MFHLACIEIDSGMQEDTEHMLRSRFSGILEEEEKAREEAWSMYLSQHAHDFSGSSSASLPALASLGIDIVISMVSTGDGSLPA